MNLNCKGPSILTKHANSSTPLSFSTSFIFSIAPFNDAGFWGGKDDDKFEELKLNDGENYQVWIDYLGSRVNVTMALASQKAPKRPLISELVNLSDTLLDEIIYVHKNRDKTFIHIYTAKI